MSHSDSPRLGHLLLCPGRVRGDRLRDPTHCPLWGPADPQLQRQLRPPRHSPPPPPPAPPVGLRLPPSLCFLWPVPEPISLGPRSCCVSSGSSYAGSPMSLRFPVSAVPFPVPLSLLPVPGPLSVSLCACLFIISLSPPSCPISHLWVWVPVLVVLGVPELHLRVAWCQLAPGLPLVWAPRQAAGPLKPTASRRSQV